MNTLSSKTNASNKLMYQFTDKLNLKNPNKNMALANLSIYYTWKKIKSSLKWTVLAHFGSQLREQNFQAQT